MIVMVGRLSMAEVVALASCGADSEPGNPPEFELSMSVVTE